jgi:hypothetical protein
VASHSPADDEFRVFLRVFPGAVTGVDQVELAVRQALVEVSQEQAKRAQTRVSTRDLTGATAEPKRHPDE